jgi:hypothetical protein
MQVNTEQQKIYFRSEGHKARFHEGLRRMGKKAIWDNKIDQEYGAMLLILTALGAIWVKMDAYITPNGINIEEALKEVHFSSTERAMVALAGNLFGQDIHVDPLDLIPLDPRNFEVAVQALRMRKNPYRLADIEA